MLLWVELYAVCLPSVCENIRKDEVTWVNTKTQTSFSREPNMMETITISPWKHLCKALMPLAGKIKQSSGVLFNKKVHNFNKSLIYLPNRTENEKFPHIYGIIPVDKKGCGKNM